MVPMNSEYPEACRIWFEDYVRGFCGLGPQLEKNVDLKRRHTARVRADIVLLAESLSLGPQDTALAEVLAIFHDVGRFEQLKRYGSFCDRVTVDHAGLGLKVLNRSGVLHNHSGRERRILVRAIWLHNKYEIPKDENAESLLFCRLIRDADKLDILGLISEHLGKRAWSPNPSLEFGLSESPGFSPEAVEDILSGRMVRIASLKNLNDMRLMYLSWVHDLYFPITFELLEERGCLKGLISGLPSDRSICTALDFLESLRTKRRLSARPLRGDLDDA